MGTVYDRQSKSQKDTRLTHVCAVAELILNCQFKTPRVLDVYGHLNDAGIFVEPVLGQALRQRGRMGSIETTLLCKSATIDDV